MIVLSDTGHQDSILRHNGKTKQQKYSHYRTLLPFNVTKTELKRIERKVETSKHQNYLPPTPEME